MKKYLFLLCLVPLVGCNTLNKLMMRPEETPAPQVPADVTVAGTIAVLNQSISVRTVDSELKVKVRKPGEMDFRELNKYEFKIYTGSIVFGHQVTINSGGTLSWKIPYEMVAPAGTEYQIRSVLVQSSLALY